MRDQKTCQELIQERFDARNEQINQMHMMVDGRFDEQLRDATEEFIEKVTTATGEEPTEEEIAKFVEEQHKNCEYTETSIDEFALGFSTYKVIKIELSWGGPADFIEAFVSDGELIKVVYHYQDWFDGAQMNVPKNSEMYEYASWFVDMYDGN